MATKLDSKGMEVIILPGKVFDVSKEKLLGPDSPVVMPPKNLDEYADGRNKDQDSLQEAQQECQRQTRS